MTDFLEEPEDNEETEVERPKHPPKPREMPSPPPVIINVPELPDARRGDSGGNGNLVSPMPDYIEPKKTQLQNDKDIEDAFKQHPRMGNVIPIRPGTMPAAAPSVAPVASPTPPPVSVPAARSAPPTGAVAAPSRAVQAAQRAAYEAQVQARRAAEIEARAFAEAESFVPEPEVRRIPVQKKSKSFVLLGVAAAALFGAVAFSMWETYSKPPDEEEDEEDEEEEEETAIEPVSSGPPIGDIVEGEIVEEEEEVA